MQQKELKRHNKLSALQVLDLIAKGIMQKGELDQHARRVCVEYLNCESDKTHTEIAHILGVSRWTIIRDLDYLEKCAVRSLAPLNTIDYAKRVRARADRLIQRARSKGDVRLEWKIEKEAAEILGRMGVIEFRFGADDNPPQPSGDIVFGDKNVQNVHASPACTAARRLTPEGREFFLKALKLTRETPAQIENKTGDSLHDSENS